MKCSQITSLRVQRADWVRCVNGPATIEGIVLRAKGWWVGDHDLGGVLVAAFEPHTARRIGAQEIGAEYLDVTAIRVPALDGQPVGIVDWEQAVRLGGAIRCPHCGWHWAATRNGRKATHCMECGAPVSPTQASAGKAA